MGIISGAPLGKVSNHIGNIIFQISRKQNVTRSMPSHYNDLNSPTQQYQRNKFKTAVGFFKKYSGVTPLYWVPREKGRTSRNSIVHYNMNNCMLYTGSEWTFIFNKIKFTKGNLFNQFNPWLEHTAGTTLITFHWDNVVPPKVNAADVLILLINSEDNSYSNCFGSGISRNVGSYSFDLGPTVVGKLVHFWGIWTNPTNTLESSSFYFGSEMMV
jgi:hypothetical protein